MVNYVFCKKRKNEPQISIKVCDTSCCQHRLLCVGYLEAMKAEKEALNENSMDRR